MLLEVRACKLNFKDIPILLFPVVTGGSNVHFAFISVSTVTTYTDDGEPNTQSMLTKQNKNFFRL